MGDKLYNAGDEVRDEEAINDDNICHHCGKDFYASEGRRSIVDYTPTPKGEFACDGCIASITEDTYAKKTTDPEEA